MVIKKITNTRNSFIGILIIFSLLSQLLIPIEFSNKATAAPPDTRTIYLEEGTPSSPNLSFTECTAHIGVGNIYIPYDLQLKMEQSTDQSLKDDISSILKDRQDGTDYIYIIYKPVNESFDNGQICQNGNMLSRPSKPTEFIGITDQYNSTSTLIYGQLNASAKTLTFSFNNGSQGASTTYNVVNEVATVDVFSNPLLSSSGGGSIGYCANASSSLEYSACMSAVALDFNTILYRGEKFVLDDWRGDDMEYYLTETPYQQREFFKNQANTCKPRIQFNTGNSDQSDGETFDVNVDNDNASEFRAAMEAISTLPSSANIGYQEYTSLCVKEDQRTITVTGFSSIKTMFQVFPKEKKIVFITKNPSTNEGKFITGEFVQDTANPLKYVAPPRTENCSSEEMKPFVLLSSAPSEANGARPIQAEWTFQTDSTGCASSSLVKANVLVKQTPASSTETSAGVGSTNGTIEDPEEEAVQECEDSFSSFGVIICWMLKAIDGILGLLENIIKSLLIVDTDNYSATETNNQGNSEQQPLYTAWLSLARVASGLLVMVALVMVLGTALGDYKLFNAYTVKKVLPRIVVAAVGIWLSWAIVSAYIDSINVIGKGIADLLWTPFEVTTERSFEEYGLDDVFGSAAQDTGGATEAVAGTALGFTMIGGVVAAGAVALGGGAAILSALIPVLVFMLVGFVVLVLRQSIIIFLLAVAPIAVVSWILPNTKKLVWDKWLKFLNQLLFMFPLFMGILAAGKIFAYVASTGGDGGLLSLIIPAIAYVTPFVLLPGIFKSAGGALSKVTGTLSKQGNRLGGIAQKPLKEYTDKNKQWKKGIRQNMQFDKAYNSDNPNSFSARRARAAIRARSGQNVLGRSMAPGSRGEAYNSALNRSGAAAYDEAYDKAVKDEDLAMRTNEASTYNNRDALRDILLDSNASSARKQVAVNRLVAMRQDGIIRDAISGATYTDTAGNTRTYSAQSQLLRAKNDGSLQSTFGDSAPDIARARVNADNSLSLETTRLSDPNNLPDQSKISQWSPDSLRIALENDTNVQSILDLVENNPSFAESLNAEKLRVINEGVHRVSGGTTPLPPGAPLLFTPARQQKA